jgi:hypothetical protein
MLKKLAIVLMFFGAAGCCSKKTAQSTTLETRPEDSIEAKARRFNDGISYKEQVLKLETNKFHISSTGTVYQRDEGSADTVYDNNHHFKWTTDKSGKVHYWLNGKETGVGNEGFENALREIEKLSPDKEMILLPYNEGRAMEIPFDLKRIRSVMEKQRIKEAWLNAE